MVKHGCLSVSQASSEVGSVCVDWISAWLCRVKPPECDLTMKGWNENGPSQLSDLVAMLFNLKKVLVLWKFPSLGALFGQLVQAQVKSSIQIKLYKWPYTGGESLKAVVRSRAIPVHLLPSCGKFRAKVTSWDRIMALFGLASRA